MTTAVITYDALNHENAKGQYSLTMLYSKAIDILALDNTFLSATDTDIVLTDQVNMATVPHEGAEVLDIRVDYDADEMRLRVNGATSAVTVYNNNFGSGALIQKANLRELKRTNIPEILDILVDDFGEILADDFDEELGA